MNDEIRPEHLHAAADALNEVIEAFEDELRQQHFSVRVSVKIDTEHNLGFERHGSRFRLVVGETALVSCSRLIRLQAVAVFVQLHAALVERTREELQHVQEATSTVRAFTDQIRKQRTTTPHPRKQETER